LKFLRKHGHKNKKSEEGEPTEASTVIKKRIEEKKVQDRVAIGPHIVYETIRREGEGELNRSTSSLAWSGLATGLSMGFSLVAEGLLDAHLPNSPWTPLLSKFGYSVGFLIVILGRQQALYGDNTHCNSASVNEKKSEDCPGCSSPMDCCSFGEPYGDLPIRALHRNNSSLSAANTASSNRSRGATEGGFGEIFMRAIFAGWLIALLVWLLPAAESGHVSIIIIISYFIELAGFNHVVAGSTKLLLLVVNGVETWGTFPLRFFLPTLLGNIVGGVSLVAFLGMLRSSRERIRIEPVRYQTGLSLDRGLDRARRATEVWSATSSGFSCREPHLGRP
jgi:formate/nitrite transporter FocA (FNT family)